MEDEDKRLAEVLAGEITEEVVAEVQQLVEKVALSADCVEDIPKEVEEEKIEDIRQVILKARLPQKIKLALLGNATCRALLIKDSNKMIQQFVLKNPKLQLSEVEDFGKNPNLSEQVFRTIAGNSQWMKSYSLKTALVFNAKTPQDISVRWVKFLNATDIKRLSKSKNVPNAVALTARKRLAEMNDK